MLKIDSKFINVHPEDIVLNRQSKLSREHNLFLVMPEFFKDRANTKFIYAGAVPGPGGISIHNVSDISMREYVLSVLSPGVRLFFDDSHEGIFFYSIIDKIHAIIGKDRDIGIDGSQIYYVSGTANALDLYKKYCIDNNISNTINISVVNSWEFSINCGKINNRFNVIKEKEKLFLCFNRILRPHRLALLGLLLEKQLVEKSYYSFFLAQYGDIELDLSNASTILNYHFPPFVKNKILKQITKIKDKLPLKINIDSGQNNKNYLDSDDMQFFDNSYFSLVTETNYFRLDITRPNCKDTIFFSEKIFKPIKVHHPFILVSSAHSLKYLRKMGYRTFSPFIDESYDDIEDGLERIISIVKEVERLSKLTKEEWIKWQHDISDILSHNYRILNSRTNYEFIDT